jgi:hypothetical protein
LKVQPYWFETFDNRPSFQVLLSNIPDEYVYETDGKGHYRGQCDDAVSYMFSDGKPTRGYGGRQFNLKMVDGTVFSCKGGWSSNAATINRSWPKNPVADASITANPDVMADGHTFYSGAVTVESILRWWLDNHHKVDWGIALMFDAGSCWLEPTKGRFVKWGHQINIACRFMPIVDIGNFEAYRERLLSTFWSHWHGLTPTFTRDDNGELDGSQMMAVRA